MSFISTLSPLHQKSYCIQIRQETFDSKFTDIAQSYFITGIPGSGKTSLSLVFVRKWLAYMEVDSNHELSEARFISFFELIKLSRNSNDRTTEEGSRARSQLQYLRDVPLLVLDDIGTEKHTEYVLETVSEFINHRYEQQKQTVFTSNYTLDELKQKYDERIASRITGMCGLGNVIRMNPIDYRQNSVGTSTTKTVQASAQVEESQADSKTHNWIKPSTDSWKEFMNEKRQSEPMLVEYVNQILAETKTQMSWKVYIAATRRLKDYYISLA